MRSPCSPGTPSSRFVSFRGSTLGGVQVFSINNTFNSCESFEASYANPLIEHIAGQVLDGWRPDILVQLRPTSPLRPCGMVDAAVVALARDRGCDSLPAVVAPAQNPYKMWRRIPGSPYLMPLLTDVGSEAFNRPRQALPERHQAPAAARSGRRSVEDRMLSILRWWHLQAALAASICSSHRGAGRAVFRVWHPPIAPALQPGHCADT